jgi:hypothetical protein
MTCDHSEALKLAQLGQWHESHAMVQPYYDRKSCLIHAYLHRVEGDLSNARYWYRQAGESMPNNTLEEELDRLQKVIGL